MATRRRKRHSPEQIVRKLRDADAMLSGGKDLSAILQALEVSEATYARWRSQYGGMKAEEAVRLKKLEDENKRLKQLVADQALDIQDLAGSTLGRRKLVPQLADVGQVGRNFPATKWPVFKILKCSVAGYGCTVTHQSPI